MWITFFKTIFRDFEAQNFLNRYERIERDGKKKKKKDGKDKHTRIGHGDMNGLIRVQPHLCFPTVENASC